MTDPFYSFYNGYFYVLRITLLKFKQYVYVFSLVPSLSKFFFFLIFICSFLPSPFS